MMSADALRGALRRGALLSACILAPAPLAIGAAPLSAAGSASPSGLTEAVADALRSDPALREPIRGNVTLADDAAQIVGLGDRDGAAAVRIAWRSSDPAVLSDMDQRTGRDVIRKGVVARRASDVRVRLTATVTGPGTKPLVVPIDVVVAAKPAAASSPPTAYMFVYFTGNTVEGEKLRFAMSDGNDALQWRELNAAQPILESHAGTRGLRDPFIMRSAEGDRFFLLATDLSTGRAGWGGSTDRGSHYLEIWESVDLIHWGEQRHVKVSPPSAGMTWAPEATYDPSIGAYVVYWTSTLYTDAAHTREDGSGPQILSAITRDFRSFTPATPWLKASEVPGMAKAKGLIDATVLRDGKYFYRFTKGTDAGGCPSPDIFAQRTTALRATGASGAWQLVDRCIGRRAGTPEVEGPSIFAANPGDVSGFKYFLWVDDYRGVGYIPLATKALGDRIAWTYPAKFHLPSSPRHGSVLPITAQEHDALALRWNPALLPVPTDTAARGDAAERWIVPPVLASGTRLPAPAGYSVRWQADGVTLAGDTLVNAGDAPRTVRLTGTLFRPGAAAIEKRFAVRLLGPSARQLRSYARVPTTAHDANQPVIARSVHLSLGDGRRDPVPLNDNYGVIFARGDYVAVDRVALRGVADPSLFHFADGSLGVIATRVDLDGKPDAPPSSTVLFKSDPAHPADFTELGTLDLRTPDGVTRPRAVWDTAMRRYVVAWTDGSGHPRWASVADLARTEAPATPFFPENGGRRSRVVSAGNVGELRSGALATVDAAEPLPVDAATAAALTRRFGRIVNVAATVAPRSIAAKRVGDLSTARVRLDYSDGSSAMRAVDWDADDLRRLAAARPGTYSVRGTVRQRSYPAIFAYNRADPDIYRWVRGGKVRYLFVATDDTNNGNVSSEHLPIRVADTIAQLADDNGGRAREVDLLNRHTRRDRTAEGRTIAGCYWAPELHEIGGRLSILFAPCFNPKDDASNEGGTWFTVESHIMQLRDGGDPANPADWSKPAAVRKADGTRLGRAEMARNISLDMSVFQVGGQSYYTWSQRYLPESGALGDPLAWIARVDPAHPTRLASAPMPIIAPDLSFEENLAEGGFALQHDGRVTLVYSSSGVSPTYVVGGVFADAKADLTRIDSWRKWQAPLQKSEPMPAGVTDYRRFEQGPGHGAFTTDEDGHPLYVYHSWGNGVGGDGRDARVRRMHWAADGRPILDMTADEEVAPANRAVTMTVTLR